MNIKRLRIYTIGGFLVLTAITTYLFVKVQTLSGNKNTVLGATTSATAQPIVTITPLPTSKPKTYIDSDPIISCTMSKECGGDIRQVKKSECTNGVCCQIGSTWIFYPSKDKCLQDQKANSPKTVSCALSYGTFQLTESDCNNFKSKDVTWTNPPQATIIPVVLITAQPIATPDEQQRAERIQTCQDHAKSVYDQALTSCGAIARAQGAASSTQYQQCGLTATNNYDYQRAQCNYIN